MSRVYTGAEARALRERALTRGDEVWGVGRLDCGDYFARHIGTNIPGKSVSGEFLGDGEALPLLAAAPDLSRSVEHWEARALAAEARLFSLSCSEHGGATTVAAYCATCGRPMVGGRGHPRLSHAELMGRLEAAEAANAALRERS